MTSGDSPTTIRWRSISTAKKREGDFIYVRGPGLQDCVSQWGKVSHVPLYGWLDMNFDDPENITALSPQPTEWNSSVGVSGALTTCEACLERWRAIMELSHGL